MHAHVSTALQFYTLSITIRPISTMKLTHSVISFILSLYCGLTVGIDKGCPVRPQRNPNLSAIQGVWWKIKWIAPRPLPLRLYYLRYNWNVRRDNQTGFLEINKAGRRLTAPRDCIFEGARMDPIGNSGMFRYTAPSSAIQDATFVLIATDYLTYAIWWGCEPVIRPGCRVRVDAFSRDQFAGPRLVNFVDRIIETRTCLNVNNFFFTQRLSWGVRDCSRGI